MQMFLQSFASLLVAPLIGLLGLAGYTIQPTTPAAPVAVEQRLGASNPIETPIALFHSSLANAITSSATTMTLTSGLTLDGTTLASSTYSFVIDSGQSNQEFVIADCTNTTCTNMTRGLSTINGTSSVTALQQAHRRTATVDIVDAPLLLKLTSYASGNVGYPNLLSYAPSFTYLSFTSGSQIIDKDYADHLAFAACGNASVSSAGCIQLGTAAQIASTTSTGSTGAALVIPGSMATSSNDVAGLHAVITQNSGKINWNQIDLGTPFTVTASSTYSGGLASTGTTTISASNVNTNPLKLNGLPYAFPSACTGSSTILSTDGNGNITCEQPFIKTLALNTNIGVAVTNSSATTTAYQYVIPAGTLTTANIIHAKATLVASGSNLCWAQIDIGNGTATTTLGFMSIAPSGNTPVQIGADVMATSSNDVYGAFSAFNNQVYSTNSTFGGIGGTVGASGAFAHINTAAQLYLVFGGRINSGGTGSCNFDAVDINVERQQ